MCFYPWLESNVTFFLKHVNREHVLSRFSAKAAAALADQPYSSIHYLPSSWYWSHWLIIERYNIFSIKAMSYLIFFVSLYNHIFSSMRLTSPWFYNNNIVINMVGNVLSSNQDIEYWPLFTKDINKNVMWHDGKFSVWKPYIIKDY